MITRDPAALAVFIKNQRKKQKLSQAALGELVGLKQTTISAFEKKPVATKLDTLFRILAACNLEIKIQSTDTKPTDWSEEW